MFVAEVIARDGVSRLRAIDEERTIFDMEDEPDDCVAGAIVEAEVCAVPGRARVRRRDGAPVILARAGTGLARVYRIAGRNALRVAFPEAVTAEAAALLASPGIDDPSLTDMTHLPFVTIDYAESRDLDQALYVERGGDGYVVYYALADAAFYVRPGTALFAEALRRSASYYLPGLTIPMLPTQLSEGIVSLNEKVERRALVFVIQVSVGGKLTGSRLVRARVRSRAKLTYDGVQQMHDAPSAQTVDDAPYGESLRLLGEVGALRIQEAEARDVVRYDRVAARVHLADGGRRVIAEAEPRNAVQRWNEQISLMCNIEGARFLTRRVDPSTGYAGVFRVHPPPEAERVAELAALISHLVDVLELPERWRWVHAGRDRESLADYIERLPHTGHEARLSKALQRQAMLINHPSFFTTEAGPHYGIGAVAYSRFSSPMREIVGVVTKHMAFHQLHGTAVADGGLTPELIQAAVDGGNEAKKIQKRISKEANKLAMDELFRGDLDVPLETRPTRSATVMGVSDSKLYLQLDDPPVEIKVYAEDVARHGGALSLRNRFELGLMREGAEVEDTVRVGDEIRICPADYDRDRRRWLFRLV